MRTLLLLGLMALTSHQVLALENLLSTTQQAQQQELQHNQNREQSFEQDVAALKKRQVALLAKRDSLMADTDQLSDAFANNEKSLAELETELHLATGVVRYTPV